MEAAPAIALRVAKPADAGPLAELYLAARRAALPGIRQPWSDADVARWMAETLIGAHSVLVAEQAGRPLGYAGFGSQGGEAMLLHLYIAPGAWRRGLGSRLLSVVQACAPGRLRLYTFARNRPARAFYARHGFAEIAFGAAETNEEGEADVLLEWTAPARAAEDREP